MMQVHLDEQTSVDGLKTKSRFQTNISKRNIYGLWLFSTEVESIWP